LRLPRGRRGSAETCLDCAGKPRRRSWGTVSDRAVLAPAVADRRLPALPRVSGAGELALDGW